MFCFCFPQQEDNLQNLPLEIKPTEPSCKVTGIIGPPGPSGPQVRIINILGWIRSFENQSFGLNLY